MLYLCWDLSQLDNFILNFLVVNVVLLIFLSIIIIVFILLYLICKNLLLLYIIFMKCFNCSNINFIFIHNYNYYIKMYYYCELSEVSDEINGTDILYNYNYII